MSERREIDRDAFRAILRATRLYVRAVQRLVDADQVEREFRQRCQTRRPRPSLSILLDEDASGMNYAERIKSTQLMTIANDLRSPARMAREYLRREYHARNVPPSVQHERIKRLDDLVRGDRPRSVRMIF